MQDANIEPKNLYLLSMTWANFMFTQNHFPKQFSKRHTKSCKKIGKQFSQGTPNYSLTIINYSLLSLTFTENWSVENERSQEKQGKYCHARLFQKPCRL